MNAPTTFPALPLGDGAASAPPIASASVAEGETAPHKQYLRLFGMIPPEQVITVNPTSLRDDGSDGASPSSSEAVGQTRTSALCDPTQAARHPLYQLLETMEHPSALTLASVAALRERHMAKGHTPAADAAHGPLFFKHAADEAYRTALLARSPETRRKRLITAVAILVAQIDAEAHAAQQQEPTP